MENRPIAVIVTGAGAPGIQGTLYSLKQNYDNRSFHVIGTDINDFVVGKYLCDEFCVISPAKKEEEYLSDLMSICILSILKPHGQLHFPKAAVSSALECNIHIIVPVFLPDR